ncbi:PD-(D/E)XK nuclease family protein [Chloroflexota bacterium]
MKDTDSNIFTALGKYNSPVDENYLTESFVYVLNALLKRNSSVACRLLNKMCVNDSEFEFTVAENIDITTQEVTKLGRPDIKISTPDKLIYIEVKHESPLGENQILRYNNALSGSEAKNKHVVLLTRYDIDWAGKSSDEKPYKHIKWLYIHQLLSIELTSVTDPVNIYLVESFMKFLEVKQMSIQKVGWEYIKGIPEMLNLIGMMEFCIENAGIKLYQQYPRAVALEWRGFYLESNNYLCFIYYAEPLKIYLQIVNKKGYERSRVPKSQFPVTEDNKSIYFHLQLEEHYFFSLDKEKQIEVITDFIKTSLKDAKQMKLDSV